MRHEQELFQTLFEAQQRYFSYRALLVAIISENSVVLVFFWDVAQLSRDMLQDGVSHRRARVKLGTNYRGCRIILGRRYAP